MEKCTAEQLVDLDLLPTLPSVAIEAIRLMEGEASTFDSIAELLKSDQVLTSKILHYANSAAVGSSRKITSIPQAISTVGFNAIRSIILSVTVFDSFSSQSDCQEALIDFWLHSIGVAVTSEILARKLGYPDPDEAYLAGLIHDLGKLILFIQHPEGFIRLGKELEEQAGKISPSMLPLGIEKDILGISHIEAGRIISQRLGFPKTLSRVMWLHHQPVIEKIVPEAEQLPQLVRFADVLCVTHNVGCSYFLTSGPFNHDYYNFALGQMVSLHGLTEEDLHDLMKEVHQRVEGVSTLIGIWDEEAYYKMVGAANVSLGSMSRRLEQSNRLLLTTNQVLSAACKMNQQLQPGLVPQEAAKVVVTAACEAFDVQRALCFVWNIDCKSFVGCIIDNGKYYFLDIPGRMSDIDSVNTKTNFDIEQEALKSLKEFSYSFARGEKVEKRVADFLDNSNYLTSFFMSDKKSKWRKEQLFGELLIDFSSIKDLANIDNTAIVKNFEALSSSAGTAIERILLEIDLTRQARKLAAASRKMEENQRQLFHSHRLATVGRLAAGASHEINNPLTIISLNLQIVKRLLGDTPENKEVLERLQIAADQEQRISKIIQDLMGFARPSEPKFLPTNAAEIINKVIAVIGDRVSMEKIEVVNEFSTELPLILVDPLQLEQVFMNLFINANHAMPDGGTLSIKGKDIGKYIEIEVADTGSGISKSNLGKVFDPFFTTKLEGEGTGLGLAVCHSIIEHNSGRMRVESKVDVGTTFTITLPIDSGNRLREMKEILKPASPGEGTEPVRQTRVLVIDDEPLLNDILRESLKANGYQAEGAYDGVEGIGKLRYQRYDLVLLDIRMPRKDGLEVLEFIKREYPQTQVIIITGLASLPEIKDTVKMGAFACLRKPFMLDKVLETVKKALKAGKKKKMKSRV